MCCDLLSLLLVYILLDLCLIKTSSYYHSRSTVGPLLAGHHYGMNFCPL